MGWGNCCTRELVRAVSIVAAFAWAAVTPFGCGGGDSAGQGGGPGAPDAAPDSRSRPEITLTPADTIFELTPDYLELVVSDVAGACSYTMKNEVKANARGVIITVLGHPPVAGTYTVDSTATPTVQAIYGANDDACRPLFPIPPFARNGSMVTIRSIASDRVDGSYALVFGAASMMNGDFTALPCAPLRRPNPTCAP
jgi:hypothetical protein